MRRITEIKNKGYGLNIKMTAKHKNIAVTFIYDYCGPDRGEGSPHIMEYSAVKERTYSGFPRTFGSKKTFYSIHPSSKWGYKTYDMLNIEGEEAVWRELEWRVNNLQISYGK